jgi:hypothetical protein
LHLHPESFICMTVCLPEHVFMSMGSSLDLSAQCLYLNRGDKTPLFFI